MKLLHKFMQITARCRGLRLVRRFAGESNGATAIEFGIVAAPFLALTFAILETAIVFFAGQVMETAVADSARLVMTGQAQTASYTQAQFKQALCGRIYAVFDCANGLYIDVRSYSAFSAADMSRPVDSTGKLIQDFRYQPGGPGDIVVVRAVYEWPVWVTLLGFNLADMSGGKRLIMATAALRNEVYQ